MNLAIVIGISEYNNISSLPSCKNDVNLINNILKASAKYDDILFIENNTSSQSIKRKVIDFIKKYRSDKYEIEEFFMYYSGHGYFDGNEFYYICTDFNKEKIKQTSFENKEFDNYIKLLNPKLTVKVVDSCQSGVQYIKDLNNFQEYIQKDQNTFNNCYFLYSSQNHQSSYTDTKISFFTKEFIESLIKIEINNIRYKDIIDYISDSFIDNNEQKPFFVIQADLTEEFIIKEDKIINIIKTFYDDNISVVKHNKNKSLVDFVEDDSKNYFKKEQVLKILNNIKEKIQNFVFDENNITKLYQIEINFNDSYYNIPKVENIAKWADKHKKDFFIKLIYTNKTVTKKIPKINSITKMLISNGFFNDETKYETKEVEIAVPSSISSTTELDYNHVLIKCTPNYPNLFSTAFIIIPFVSKTKLLFFTTFITYINIGWDEEKINEDSVEWVETQIPLIDEKKIYNYIKKSLENFMYFTLDEVKKSIDFNEEIIEVEEEKEKD